MWDEFFKDIEGEEFEDMEDYENWVLGWVEDSEHELGKIERWATDIDKETAERELGITINTTKE